MGRRKKQAAEKTTETATAKVTVTATDAITAEDGTQQQIAPHVIRACAYCATAEERDYGLFCPEEGGPVGRADSCTEFTTEKKNVGDANVDAVDTDVDTATELTPETDEPPRTCGNCLWQIVDDNDGDSVVACGQQVVDPEDFDPACPGCDQWKSDLEDWEDVKRSLADSFLTAEMPGSRPTIDFNLYRFPNFEHELRVALCEAYNYLGKGGEGDPSITIKLSNFRDTIKAAIVVDLPHKIKINVGSVETVRENGEFRIVLKPEQQSLFDDNRNVENVEGDPDEVGADEVELTGETDGEINEETSDETDEETTGDEETTDDDTTDGDATDQNVPPDDC